MLFEECSIKILENVFRVRDPVFKQQAKFSYFLDGTSLWIFFALKEKMCMKVSLHNAVDMLPTAYRSLLCVWIFRKF